MTPEQRATLHRMAPLCARLQGDLAARHEGVVNLLLAEKSFETVDGLTLTEGMRLAVVGQAALLQLHDGADYFPQLDSIVLYPRPFVVEHEHWDDGLVHADPAALSGESWHQGAVVLAWSDVRDEARHHNGYNVVVHEFTHQLDEETGAANGIPRLRDAAAIARWHEAFLPAYERHVRLLERDRHVLFDEHAAENPAEFLATAVELFFELPDDLAAEYGDVFACLADWLALDPRRTDLAPGP